MARLRFVRHTMHYDYQREYTPPEGWLVRDVHFRSEWSAEIVLEEDDRTQVSYREGGAGNPCLTRSIDYPDQVPTYYTQADMDAAVKKTEEEAASKTRINASNLCFAIERGSKATAVGAYHNLTGSTMVASKQVIDKIMLPRNPNHWSAASALHGTVVRIDGKIGQGDLAGFVLEKLAADTWNTTAIEDDYTSARVQAAAATSGFKILWEPK